MKSLINPLLWFLLLQTAGLCVLLRRMSGRSRLLWSLLLLSILLGMASTPLTWRGLEASLMITSSIPDSTIAPAYIIVLGGGYLPGVIPEEDVLVVESQRRVLRAITLWRRFPNARLVLSGAVHEYDGFREPDRLAQLMADAAMRRGVADISNTAGAALDQHAGASDRGSETFGSHIHHTHRSRDIRLAYTPRRAGVPQIFSTSVQLSGAAASGCDGVAVSHSLGRLTWRQYASSSGMGGYPVVQNPLAEGDARERMTICVTTQTSYIIFLTNKIDARPLVRLCLDMNWTHASS